MNFEFQLRGITKRFGAFTALDSFYFEVKSGEIVALLGENGAGKSTAISVIGGENRPDDGQMLWNGEAVMWSSPREAARRGIGVVHQHFSLVPALSVAQNLAIASGGAAIFRPQEWEKRARDWAESLGWKIEPSRRVEELSVGEAQRVEILKALFSGGGARLLLLDEPTANLTPREADQLSETLRALRARGLGIVFVSHKLREVMALCDRAFVLRRGKLVGKREISATNVADLAQLMVGNAAAPPEMQPTSTLADAPGEVLLKVENLSTKRLKNLDFELRVGEIVALAGVDGNGQRELFEVLAGILRPESGSFRAEAMAFVPPDRRVEGLILEFDIAENLALGEDFRRRCGRGPWLNWNVARQRAGDVMERYDIRAPQSGQKTLAARLSGGNAQKIVLARALESEARVIVALDPTRGLDIGAARFVHQKLREAAQIGRAVLLVSTDLDEVLALGDRFGALFGGQLIPAKLEVGATREQIGKWMGGEV
ncbi:MAG TPA: ABC transporter ATP-binding protein [Abditibacterium sp.]